MVERMLSMHEVPGSIPSISIPFVPLLGSSFLVPASAGSRRIPGMVVLLPNARGRLGWLGCARNLSAANCTRLAPAAPACARPPSESGAALVPPGSRKKHY